MSSATPSTDVSKAAAPVKPAKNPYWAAAQPFVLGGLSGMIATTCIQPIDMVKVSIQLEGKGGITNPFTMARKLIAQEGVLSLYRGLSAGLLRQATYTTARMGLFSTIANSMKDESGQLTFAKRSAAGLIAGGLGSIVGNPCDLALVRMQADAGLPKAERRNYKNVVDALIRIVKEDGVTGLWAGSFPTVLRAMSLNMGMLASYDQSKEMLEKQFGKNPYTTFAASGVAGFFASFMSLPFDFVKTRIQKMKPDAQGVMPYTGPFNCTAVVLREEGPMAFYKGFTTYYFRIAPHAMITLLAVEALKVVIGD